MKSKLFALFVLAVLIIVAVTVFVLCTESVQMINTFRLPTWQGITPGVTTRDEALRILGKPDLILMVDLGGAFDLVDVLQQVGQCLYGQSIYHYRGSDVTVYIRSGKVWAIWVSALAFPENPRLSEFINLYGNPDHVAWSKRDPHSSVVIFANSGVLVHVNPVHDVTRASINGVVYFKPMALPQVLREFRKEFSTTGNPFPPLTNQDILIDNMDPWGFNQ